MNLLSFLNNKKKVKSHGYCYDIINHGSELGGIEIVLKSASKFHKNSFKQSIIELVTILFKNYNNNDEVYFQVTNTKLVPIYKRLFKPFIVFYSSGEVFVVFNSIYEAYYYITNNF